LKRIGERRLAADGVGDWKWEGMTHRQMDRREKIIAM
jgi:hypothetical protein